MIYPLVASLNPPRSLNLVETLSCPLVHTDSYPYARKIPKGLKESSMVNEYPRNLATRDVFPPTNPWCLLLKTHLWLTFRGWHNILIVSNMLLYGLKSNVFPQQTCMFAEIQVFHPGFFLLFKSYTYILFHLRGSILRVKFICPSMFIRFAGWIHVSAFLTMFIYFVACVPFFASCFLTWQLT